MLFAGKYELLDQLGEGAMGVVYRARHVLLDLDMAVKVLRPQYSADEGFRKRFMREARIPLAFVHKRSVTLRDFGIGENDALYLAMDLCPGLSLTQIIKNAGFLDPIRACLIALQVLEVLAEAHNAGILHRDIKPDNIMVDGAGGVDSIKVMDFGIAKLIEGDASQTNLTAGSAIGTPLYMSPEQAAGERLDQRSDLYALGVVMFEMLTGQPPFQAERVQALLMKHLTQPVPPLLAQRGIDPDLERIVLTALAKTPGERFASAEVFTQALQEWVQQARTRPLSATGPVERVDLDKAGLEKFSLEKSNLEKGFFERSGPDVGGLERLGSEKNPGEKAGIDRQKSFDSAPFRAVRPANERKEDVDDDTLDSVSFVRPAGEFTPPPSSLAGSGEEDAGWDAESTGVGRRPAAGAEAAASPRQEPSPRRSPRAESPQNAEVGEGAGPSTGGRWLRILLTFLSIPALALLIGMVWLLAAGDVPGSFQQVARAFPELVRPLLGLPGYNKLTPYAGAELASDTPTPAAVSTSTPVAEKASTPVPVRVKPKPKPVDATPTPAPPKPAKPEAGGAFALSVDSFEDEALVPRKQVLLTGSVPGGGERATLDNDEIYVIDDQFVVLLDLKEGKNTLRLTGRKDGNAVTRILQITVDSERPKLTIDLPRARERVLRPRVPVKGKASDAHLKQVTLNGEPLSLQAGVFDTLFELKRGQNTLILIAEDQAGNRTRKVVNVQHGR